MKTKAQNLLNSIKESEAQGLSETEVFDLAKKIHTAAGIPMTQKDTEYISTQYKHIVNSRGKVTQHWVNYFYARLIFGRTEAYRSKVQQCKKLYGQKYDEIKARDPHAKVFSFESKYNGILNKYLNSLISGKGIACSCDWCTDKDAEDV